MDIFPDNWAAYTEKRVKTWYGHKWEFCMDDDYRFGFFKDETPIEKVRKWFSL